MQETLFITATVEEEGEKGDVFDLSRRIAATFFAKARSNLNVPIDGMAVWQTHSRCGALSYSRGTELLSRNQCAFDVGESASRTSPVHAPLGASSAGSGLHQRSQAFVTLTSFVTHPSGDADHIISIRKVATHETRIYWQSFPG